MKKRDRFLIRRRILETLILLWVAAYAMGYFDDQKSKPGPEASPITHATPAATPQN